MFLFLSKLLPIFIYPLGLSCLLMGVALLTLWKRPRVASGCLVLSLALVFGFSNVEVSGWLGRSLEWQYLPLDNLPTADAIVVLGGAVRSADPPRPWVDVMESGDRPIHAAQLYLAGKAPKIIMSGGRINWRGGGPSESADMAALAEALGVPAEDILEDPRSLNTYQNAVNVKQILDEEGMERILLVTSAIHMPRSIKIFQRLGIEAIAAPTDFRMIAPTEPHGRSLQASILNTLPDAERLEYSTRALKEYIGMVVYRLRGWL